MAGAYRLGADDRAHLDLPVSLQIELRAGSWRLLARGQLDLRGELDADGFANRKTISGRLRLKGRSLGYGFCFNDNDGVAHRFVGSRRLSLRGLPAAATVLRGCFEDADGQLVGHALLRFDVRSQLRFGDAVDNPG